jgi:hypothetical protein
MRAVRVRRDDRLQIDILVIWLQSTYYLRYRWDASAEFEPRSQDNLVGVYIAEASFPPSFLVSGTLETDVTSGEITGNEGLEKLANRIERG